MYNYVIYFYTYDSQYIIDNIIHLYSKNHGAARRFDAALRWARQELWRGGTMMRHLALRWQEAQRQPVRLTGSADQFDNIANGQ